jgi:CRISPR-associated endonuclease/helicase Cas3
VLEKEEPLALISTQLIEAGVDVDFPVVYRAWAPADSLQQAAGRANRNARLTEGRVVIFRPSDGKQPRDRYYEAALEATAANFGPDVADPDCLEALDRYYPARYRLAEVERTGDGVKVEERRKQLDFPAVAAMFTLIQDLTATAAVPPEDDEARDRFDNAVSRLRSDNVHPVTDARQLLRDLRPYLATIPKYMVKTAIDRGWAEPIIGDLLEWTGDYDKARGIDPAGLPGLNNKEVYVW